VWIVIPSIVWGWFFDHFPVSSRKSIYESGEYDYYDSPYTEQDCYYEGTITPPILFTILGIYTYFYHLKEKSLLLFRLFLEDMGGSG
jgi:hypothetical protein